ncbi:hypothetical protein [Micromonospora haikouensis]|uniref:hypothetical protein n=1 Tax=Micromonospora haikouensis TaxID=686309 RepID=UPI0037BB27AE
MSLGDILGLVGLAVAIFQIWRTGRIAAATKVAMEEAVRRISLFNILLVVPELSRIENDLDRAANSENPDEVRRSLREWREVASDFYGLLDGEAGNHDELMTLVRQSVTLSTVAKGQLISSKQGSVLSATKRVRESIEHVCQETRVFAAKVRGSATPLGVFGGSETPRPITPAPRPRQHAAKEDFNG